MNVTEKFASGTCAPANPLYRTSANSPTPIRQASHSSAVGSRTSARRRCCCSCGVVHIVESATNETTSTIAAAQLNSHTGIGRFARPTIPCAWALAGIASAATDKPPSRNGSLRRNAGLMPGAVYGSPSTPSAGQGGRSERSVRARDSRATGPPRTHNLFAT